jgi:quercetin dioxygenase-like cupin family protein
MEVQRMATVVRVGDGRRFRFPAGNHGEVEASRETGLGFGFLRTSMPTGTGMPFLHVHRRHDEAFQIYEGSVEYRLGDVYETAGPGDAVLVPAGVPHCFRAIGDRDASLLLIVSPADGIDVIEELANGNLLDTGWMAGVLARYDTELLEAHPHWAPRK